MESQSKSQSFLFYIYAASVIFIMLCSMHAHFSWSFDWKMMYVINWMVGIIGYIYLRKNKDRNLFKGVIIKIFILFHLAVLWNAAGVGQVLNLPVALLTVLILGNEDRSKLLQLWTKTYSLILVISLIAWTCSWFGVLDVTDTISFGDGDFYIFQNYHWLCVRGPYVLRFNSIFLEPGHTAMLGAFTIFANKYNLKNIYVLFILICSLVTLSLAGYVLIVVGYVVFKALTTSTKKIFVQILPFAIIVSAVYYISITYEGGDNFVNTFIIERLEYDDEKGIAGNNRYLGDTDATFEKFSSSSDIITGLSFSEYAKGLKDDSISGAGIKLYLLQKGIIGTLFIFLVYYLICKHSENKNFMYSMFILYILAFLQRAYPLWESWIFIFVLSSVYKRLYIEKN